MICIVRSIGSPVAEPRDTFGWEPQLTLSIGEGERTEDPPETVTASEDAGRFELQTEIGRGGMGRVVQAVDRQFSRSVAIKELSGPGGKNARIRFAREALVTGNLEHPGIPPVYARGVRPNGTPWYAMRLVRGRTFAAALATTSTLESRLALLPALIATAHTLGYAHSRGVIHRDVKPDNIVLGPFGEAVLLDWGIAKARGFSIGDEGESPAPSSATHTLHGAVMGTPQYMAPEQARGEDVDERTDVFALGALLYELLTGRSPYGGTDAREVLALAITAAPAPVATLQADAPPELIAVCERAMSAAPAGRYANASAVALAMEAVLSRAVGRRGPRLVERAANVATMAAMCAIVAGIAFAFSVGVPVAALGIYANFVWALTITGVGLSVVEWRSRGVYGLLPLTVAFAVATAALALGGTCFNLTAVFAGLASLPADHAEWRPLMANGLQESFPLAGLGMLLVALQTFMIGLTAWRARQ